jgi:DNA-binding Xre family transcriptional regulator
MERSRKLALTNWTLANDALCLRFAGTKSELAKAAKMSRTTVTAFFKGEPIREAEFRRICTGLRLNWQEISSIEDEKDDPLEQIRQHCRNKILQNYSKIRLLSGQEIGVDQLYVDVWLLDRQPRTFQRSASKMLETFDLRNDRLGLGNRIRHDPGFDVANSQPRLLILGKPGSGKTTFLKHLAVDWCNGKFQSNLLAVFIEFRQIQDREWEFMAEIDQQLGINKQLGIDEWSELVGIEKELDEIELQGLKEVKGDEQKTSLENKLKHVLDRGTEDQKIKVKSLRNKIEKIKAPLLSFMEKGRLLVLMDGFDEVPTVELRQKVQIQIGKIATDYPKNRYVMTCRTQIIEHIPLNFAAVEVSDFNNYQIKTFVVNWFLANGDSKSAAASEWDRFETAISKNAAVKELTVTPVLLGLMCLVVQDDGEIPPQASQLYRRGVELLLHKWNHARARGIPDCELGTEAYRRLDVQQKEELLIKIAARKFEDPKNFVLFEQNELLNEILHHLELPSKTEARFVLKAIEAQHGLLIERADELWSFSHLTFQEYFTTKWILSLTPEKLSQKITTRQWQKVVEQLVKAQGQSDLLLRLVKQSIDSSLANDERIQELLKTEAIHLSHGIASNRLVYLLRILENENFSPVATRHVNDLVRIRARDRQIQHPCDRNLHLNFALDLDLFRTLHLLRTLKIKYKHDLVEAIIIDLDLAISRSLELNLNLTDTLRQFKERVLAESELQKMVPNKPNKIAFSELVDIFRSLIIENRSIAYDWGLTENEKKLLQQYYESNDFLIKLLTVDNATSPEVRQEIEDNLLLPIAELKRRLPNQYGEIEQD